MSYKDWSFGRKLVLFIVVLLTIDIAGLVTIVVVSRIPDNPLSKVFASLRDRAIGREPDDETIIAESSEILKHDKDNIKALERRAAAYLDNDNDKLALADYDHLIKLQPNETKWLEQKASLISSEDPNSAAALYTRAIAMAGPTFDTLMGRAYCYRNLSKKDLALKDLRATLRMKLSCQQLNSRAELFRHFDCTDLAIIDFKTSLATTGGSDYERRDSLRHLYYLYVRTEQYQLALGALSGFIASVQDKHSLLPREYGDGLQCDDLKMMGDLLVALGQDDEALKNYQQALKLLESEMSSKIGEYYSRDYYDLHQEVELARLIKDPAQVEKIEKEATAKALAQVQVSKRTWYGGLVELVEILPKLRRDELGAATLKYFERIENDDDVQFDRIKLLILLERKAEARAALAKFKTDPKHDFRCITLYMMLGEYKEVSSAFKTKESHPEFIDFLRLRILLSTGEIKVANSLATKLSTSKRARGDDYWLLSQVALASGDKPESKRLKKIAAALGNFDALMDIRNGKL